MKLQSKYYSLLKTLLRRPVFTVGEAKEAGVPRHALAYLEKKGIVERVAKGVNNSLLESTYTC